jgi:hypothetical protein
MLDKIKIYIFQSRGSRVWNKKRNAIQMIAKFLNAGEGLLRTISIYSGFVLSLSLLVRMSALRFLKLEMYSSTVAKSTISRLESFVSSLLVCTAPNRVWKESQTYFALLLFV